MGYLGTKPQTATTLADNIVTADKIVSGAVTDAKIAAMAASKLTGQVPDANAPSGSVIQVVKSAVTGNFTTTSSSYVHATNHSLDITTTLANSRILVMCNTPLQIPRNSFEAQSCFRTSLDGYTGNIGETIQVSYSTDGWQQATTLSTLHSIGQPAGTSINYRVYVRKKTGTGGLYFPDPWGASYSFDFIAMEIAP